MAKSSKGGAFERDISKYLSKWVHGQKLPLLFWRQIASGGLLKILSEGTVGARKNLSGDIHAIHPDGGFLTDTFSIELKNGYPGGSFDKHLKYNTNDLIFDFWKQACDDAYSVEKFPLLLYKKKGLSPWAGIGENAHNIIKHHLKSFRFVHIGWVNETYEDAYFYDMHEFFKVITPDVVKNELYEAH